MPLLLHWEVYVPFWGSDGRSLSSCVARGRLLWRAARSRWEPSITTEPLRCILLPEVVPMPVYTHAKEPLIETLLLEQRIRRRAYELYVQQGNQSGSELDDWLQTEEEMLQAQEQIIDEGKANRRGQNKRAHLGDRGECARCRNGYVQ